MYTKKERRGILWEFHKRGPSIARACETLPLFPTPATAAEPLELPGKATRSGCPPWLTSRGLAEQTDWRDRGADLPENPEERARMAEVKLAEALAVLDVLKAQGPGCLTNAEKYRAGQAAREAGAGVTLADVCATLSIPKSTYEDQGRGSPAPTPRGH